MANKAKKTQGNKKNTGVKDTASARPQRKIYRTLAVAAILLITWIVFSPALKNEFVNSWDDGLNIKDNHLTATFNVATIKEIFRTPVVGSYIPLVTTSFAWERSKVGLNPWLYHLDNILLHLVCTALVYYLIWILTANFWMSAFIALLFGIHPMHVESVAWVTERKDVLYGAFYLASLICYVKRIQQGGSRVMLYALSLIFFILSLLSKIQAVSLPLTMFAVDYLLKRKFTWKLVAEKVPFLLLSAAIGIAGMMFLSSENSLDAGTQYPFIQRIFFGSYAYCAYIVKSIVPYELSALYSYPKAVNGILPWMYYASVIPIVGILTFVIVYFRKSKETIFGVIFFTVNIVFLLQILGAGKAFTADRFSYISYLGLFFIYGHFLFMKWKSKPAQTLAVTLSVIGLVIFSTVSYARCMVWRNSETLWTDVIKKYPQEAPAYNNRGIYYRETGRNDLAFADYTKVISISPGYARAYMSRGNIYYDNKQYDLALDDYNKALAGGVVSEGLYGNRGAVLSIKGEYQMALADFEQSIRMNPHYANAYKTRAICYMYMKEFNLALDDFRKYLNMTPGDDDTFNSIAVCYQYLDQIDESLVWYGKAISLKPTGSYLYNRSMAYMKKGDKANALKDATEARRLGATVSDSYLKSLQ